MAAEKEVLIMSLHPYSQEQKLQQVKAQKEASAISKKNANMLRNRLKQ